MPIPHSFTWQPFVKAVKSKRMIDPARLSPERKQLLWAGIKKEDPALAELLQTDAGFSEIKKQFNANVLFSQADFDRFTNAGRIVLSKEKLNEK